MMTIRKILIINTHPVNYHVPIYRLLSKEDRVELEVCFLWNPYNLTLKSSNWPMRYNQELLDGYQSTFLKNYVPKFMQNPNRFFGCLNPGIFKILSKRYDAVFLFGYNRLMSWLTIFFAKIYGSKVIFKGEGDLLQASGLLKKCIKSIYLKCFFKFVDYVSYSYKRNREYYQRYYIKNKQLFFMPCAVDNDYFQDLSKVLIKKEMRKKYHLPLHKKIILFVARMEKRKDPFTLLNAFFNISQESHNDYMLVFIGSGSLTRKIERAVKKRGLEKSVIMAGFQKHKSVYEYYRAADLLVLPSYYDPSPKVINEVMNFGLPVVVSDKVGTAGDLVVHGVTGEIFPASNVEALSNCLRRILKDTCYYQKLSEGALRTINQWNYQENVHSLYNILEKI